MSRPRSKTRGASRTDDSREWSIGIYSGDTPLDLRPVGGGPVLTRRDVADVDARFVADPFMIETPEGWHMFFEVWNETAGKGEIGCATSEDGLAWRYSRIVLAEPFHLSYPYVFEWNGRLHMIPESHQAGSVRLYEATDFPNEWRVVKELLRGPSLADPSIFSHADRWWLFLETNPAFRHDTLRLYHASSPLGPWLEHPASPVVDGNGHIARPAGRVVVAGDQIIRYTQDCDPVYGTKVRAFQITELTPTSYRERPALDHPLLSGGAEAWNRDGMHHVDAHQVADRWIACVDGWVAIPEAHSADSPEGRWTTRPLLERARGAITRMIGHDLPDFLIVAARNCGGTFLYGCLREHPGVHVAPAEEVGYFDEQYGRGLDWYRSQFPSRLRKYYTRGILRRPFLTGEASSGYVLNPTAMRRIAEVLPNAKLILILRNPVERAYAHYQDTVRLRIETLPFEEAIAEEPVRLRETWQSMLDGVDRPDPTIAWFAYVRTGLYARQVKTLLDLFPPDQLLILSYEEICADPHNGYARLLNYLRLPDWRPRDFRKMNVDSGATLSGAMREQLVERFKHDNAELYELLGRRFEWDR